MPPKRVVVQSSKPQSQQQQNPSYLRAGYQAVTDPENASVVRSVAIFGAAVAFFHSSWSDLLLPPL